MKVRQLQEGMLLGPREGNKLILHEDKAWARRENKEIPVVVCASVADREDEGHEGLDVGPVIYLGSNFDRFVWDGIYKHHRVLAGDLVAIVSGYSIKDFALVSYHE